MHFPDDADGDVLRRLAADGFDFNQVCTIDFNVDFDSWPPPDEALHILHRQFGPLKLYPPEDGGYGYALFNIIDEVTYQLVMDVQQGVSSQMAEYGGICESWGLMHG